MKKLTLILIGIIIGMFATMFLENYVSNYSLISIYLKNEKITESHIIDAGIFYVIDKNNTNEVRRIIIVNGIGEVVSKYDYDKLIKK